MKKRYSNYNIFYRLQLMSLLVAGFIFGYLFDKELTTAGYIVAAIVLISTFIAQVNLIRNEKYLPK